jgi:hypothetical protein
MIIEFNNRNEWMAEANRRGLITRSDGPYYEGMSPDDKYEPEYVFDPIDNELSEEFEATAVGWGQWQQRENNVDVWMGVLADDEDELMIWLNQQV